MRHLIPCGRPAVRCRQTSAARGATPAYRFEPANYKPYRMPRRKKTLFPRGNRAGQDGTVVLARGCLSTYTHRTNSAVATSTTLLKQLLPELPQRIKLAACTATAKNICFETTHCITAGSSPSTTPSRKTPCRFTRKLHGSRVVCIASTTYCFTALPRSTTAANCHQRYGSKQRGGRPRRWGSVICRSMENSVRRHLGRQLGEAKGFGGLVWRIGVTDRLPQT
jgi:hypothetical protein